MTTPFERRRAIADHLNGRRPSIAREVTDAFLERHPDWTDRFGAAARIRGEEDAAFHVEFLAGALVSDDVAAFEDYARWTAGVLESRGIDPEFLAENLRQVGDAAVRHLDQDGARLVERFVQAGIRTVNTLAGAPPAPESPGRAAGGDLESSVYLQAIRSGDRRAALNVALEALQTGATVPDIYSEILQPAQYAIGRLWERNEITVAEEHVATAITQFVIGQLYGHLDVPGEVRGNALVTGVNGELHQLGANMVADVLEADGWNVRFLGTQLPHPGILRSVEEHRPRLVGISATVLSNLPAVADLVGSIRTRFPTDVAILVGGAAFRTRPDVWRDMGADGFGRDLREAVAVADRITRQSET